MCMPYISFKMKVKNNFLPVFSDGYTIKEVQHVLDVVQKNITLSQDLYQSAMLTLNTTRDVKTMFILLQHSLDGIAQSINVLTNQHEAYSILVSNFPKMVSQTKLVVGEKTETFANLNLSYVHEYIQRSVYIEYFRT